MVLWIFVSSGNRYTGTLKKTSPYVCFGTRLIDRTSQLSQRRPSSGDARLLGCEEDAEGKNQRGNLGVLQFLGIGPVK